MRFAPLCLPLAAIVVISGCPVPTDWDEEMDGYYGASSLEFSVVGADVEANGTVWLQAVSESLSDDGEMVSVGMGYSLCDVSTASGSPTRDYSPEEDEALEQLDVRFDANGLTEQILRYQGSIGLLVPGNNNITPLNVPGDALAAGFLGDEVVSLNAGVQGCTLRHSLGRDDVTLPDAACNAGQITIDDATGTVFVAAGDRVVQVIDNEVSFIDAAGDSLQWDAELGVLYAHSFVANTLSAYGQDEGGVWDWMWSTRVPEATASIARFKGGIAVMYPSDDDTRIQLRDVFSGDLVSSVTAKGSFERVTGAAEAPIFTLTSYDSNVHVLELVEAL